MLRRASRLLSLSFFAMAAAVALAQTPGDVPAEHWATRAVESLSNKILVGYPDGAYRGARPLTRYEFAVAVNRLWSALNGRLPALEGSLAEIEQKIRNGRPGPVGPLPEMPRLSDIDLDSMRRLVDEFERELASLGADVDQIKKSLASLDARVKALEARKPQVAISGDAGILALAGFTRDGLPALTSAGNVLGVDANGRPWSFPQHSLVLHEAAVTLLSEPDPGFRAKGTFIMGNAFTSFQGLSGSAQGPLQEQQSDAAVYELMAQWDRKAVRGDAQFTFGRYGEKIPLILESVDNTPFWSNPRWDSGKFLIDGARLAMKWPGSRLDLFGGRTGTVKGVQGVLLNVPVVRSFNSLILPAERLLGSALYIDLAPNIRFEGGAAYIDSDQTFGTYPQSFNRMITLGGTLKAKVGHGSLSGGMAKNIIKQDSRTTVDNRNESYFASLSLPAGSASVEGRYTRREHNSFLNGDWGRFGAVVNPTGYTSFKGSLVLPASFGRLTASYEDAEGVDRGGNPIGTGGMERGDRLRQLSLEASFKLAHDWSFKAGWVSAEWDLASKPDPYQRFLTFQVGGPLSPQSTLSFGVQLSDADSKGQAFLDSQGLGGRYKGGVIFSQAAYRF